jgi:hypothetical protein
MGRFFQTLLGLVGLPSDLDTLLQFLGVSAGIGILMGALQYSTGGGWAWTAMFALAGFALGMMALYFIKLTSKLTSVFQQISIPVITIEEVGLVGAEAGKNGNPGKPPNKITHLALGGRVQNHSDQTVFMKFRRVAHSMAERTKTSTVSNNLTIIQGGADNPFVLATLPDIDLDFAKPNPLIGRIEIEILYGPSPKSLRYLFTYDGLPQLGIQLEPDKGQAQVKVHTSVKSIGHERLGWFAKEGTA